MKTILDKIDPKYIDCTAGTCEHVTHKMNIGVWVIIVVALVAITVKYTHGINKFRNSTH